jgi:3-oxoacyl-[acyl-carrier protein] reductase
VTVAIVVTGDSRGLGMAVAGEVLRTTDYSVLGISRAKLGPESLMGFGERFRHLDFDLRDVEGLKDLYRNRIKPWAIIAGLVNNSAAAYEDIVTNLDLARLEEMFRVNVFSGMALTKIAIRDMLLNGTRGSLVHVTSVCAHTGYKGLSMYAATKGAMEAFSRTVAREWGSRGIRSNCVAPGFMETAMSCSLASERREKIYARNSLKSATSIVSVAASIVFLLGAGASSITGQTLHVDNGSL